ncbi:hypothetical protein AGR13a_Lc120072 [Agrobacterium genomosp. 13 str. CFBP 6927]|uniref:Transposase n=1 Tax=Agrobacterium genomosp. 13 str. CFBP 6927 TaxID=1183428 RepID=A0ABM9VL66_9HYPH|nr:hypothetical protein AGR13a_Lc120072 [Agrobacterium genomosp. 13 str. CFBP 6927]
MSTEWRKRRGKDLSPLICGFLKVYDGLIDSIINSASLSISHDVLDRGRRVDASHGLGPCCPHVERAGG